MHILGTESSETSWKIILYYFVINIAGFRLFREISNEEMTIIYISSI